MVGKWQAWVPRYGATAPVGVSDVLAVAPRAREAISILRQSGVLPFAPDGAPEDWAHLTTQESETLLSLAAGLVGKLELLPRLRHVPDALRHVPDVAVHSSVVDVLTATT